MLGSRSFRWVVSLFSFAGLVGICALIWGRARPVYRVPKETASDAFLRWCTDEPGVDPVAGERYLALFGDRYLWIDLGIGLVSTAIAGMLLAVILYVSRPADTWLRTPTRRWHFISAGWAVIGWACFSAIHSFMTDFDRWQFPWCADSMGIPIFGTLVFSVMLLIICTIIGMLLTARFGQLPAPLAQWNGTRPVFSWTMTILAGLSVILAFALMIEQATISMSIANPALLLAIYLIASTRAALLAPKPIAE
jgi:hypothetical protein